MPNLDRNIVDNHYQLDSYSCIPSCVEIILKLLGRAPIGYYTLQQSWQNKTDGSFADFHNKSIEGLVFYNAYNDSPRDDDFPLRDLFATIEEEIKQGRYVAISLANPMGWHMYVIYDMAENGDFIAVSKRGKETIFANSIKEDITAMKGTDILVYRE